MTPGDNETSAPVPVTYGELMDGARLCAARAQRAITRNPFPDADAARYALTARARLLVEIARHAEVTVGRGVVQAWRDSAPTHRGVEIRDRRVQHALTWIDTLTTSSVWLDHPARPATPNSPRPVAGVHWDRARILVAAAGDLIATHRDPDGAVRPTGASAVATADPIALLSAPARLAALVGPVEPLALRCRQAGLPRATIDAALPLSDPITAASWDLAAALSFPDSAVAPIAAHGSAVDTRSPAIEWGSRLDRVATRLRALESRGRISVRTLHDVAALGLVTSHVLTTSRHTGTDPAATALALGPMTEQWRALAAHLAPLRSAHPADRVIHEDVQALLRIAHPGATTDPIARRGLVHAMQARLPALDSCAEIADRLMAATHDAWIPAKPRRPYLRDLHRPGHAARPAPPAPTGFPRMGPTLT